MNIKLLAVRTRSSVLNARAYARRQTKVVGEMFDTRALTAVERQVLKQYIERYELQKKIKLK